MSFSAAMLMVSFRFSRCDIIMSSTSSLNLLYFSRSSKSGGAGPKRLTKFLWSPLALLYRQLGRELQCSVLRFVRLTRLAVGPNRRPRLFRTKVEKNQ